ncbi:MAG: hypothetical protein ACT4OH_07560 [Methylophilaceae bacterium]
MKSLARMLLIIALLGVLNAHAGDVLGYLTDQQGQYTGPTLEENVIKMDTDRNGFADVYEVRAFLELKHGSGYQKNVLDRWQVAAMGASCGTSFAKDLSN